MIGSLGRSQVTLPLNHSMLCVLGPLPPTLHRNALPYITPQPLTRHSHKYSQTLSHQGDLLQGGDGRSCRITSLPSVPHLETLNSKSEVLLFPLQYRWYLL